MADHEPKRRPYLTETGEPLLVQRDPYVFMDRFSEWLKTTGLGPDHILTSTLIAVPLPAYPENGDFGDRADGTPRRRWEGMRAEMMWHPLFWLPPRSAYRYTVIPDETAQPEEGVLEDDDAWAVRIAMELSGSLLYHEETGTWMDVLSTVGLDIDSPADVTRVQEWLDGADDELIDGIDLSPLIDRPDEEDWAFTHAEDWLEDLRVLAMVRQSECIIIMVDFMIEDLRSGKHDITHTAYWVNVSAWVAQQAFLSLGKSEFDFFQDIINATGGVEATAHATPAPYHGSQQDLLQGPIRTLVSRLRTLYDHYVALAEDVLRDSGDAEGAKTLRIDTSHPESVLNVTPPKGRSDALRRVKFRTDDWIKRQQRR